MAEEEIDVMQSRLVPKHEILGEEEKEKFVKEFNVSLKQLPRMLQTDPVVKQLGAKKGDIIRITRKNEVAGEYSYYRVVV